MSRVLVVYGTTEGHPRKVAELIGARLRKRGHATRVIDAATPEPKQVQPLYDGVIVGGSLHQGEHQTALAHFVKDKLDWLRGLPRAFFSVSLGVALRDAGQVQDARRLGQPFVDETRLDAGIVRCCAGALLYTKSDGFKRFVMKAIARKKGGAVDPSQDYEYTDWNDVTRFVEEYLAATGMIGQMSHG